MSIIRTYPFCICAHILILFVPLHPHKRVQRLLLLLVYYLINFVCRINQRIRLPNKTATVPIGTINGKAQIICTLFGNCVQLIPAQIVVSHFFVSSKSEKMHYISGISEYIIIHTAKTNTIHHFITVSIAFNFFICHI